MLARSRRTQPVQAAQAASEQDVRNASVAGLRLARTSLVVTALISLVSLYFSIAAGKHLWPWRVDLSLTAAGRVTVYEGGSFPSSLGPNTDRTTITIVNNADSPARDIFLYIPVKATTNHAAIGKSSGVGLPDIQPCHQETYNLITVLKANSNEYLGSTSRWYVYYTIDGHSWRFSIENDSLSKSSGFVRSINPDVVYEVGGVSHLRGFLSESILGSSSNGPGCG